MEKTKDGILLTSGERQDRRPAASGFIEPDKLSISQWAEDDKPREKLMTLGADSLSNAELLAILIGSGSRKESAVDLMKRLLGDCENNLNAVGRLSISELMKYRSSISSTRHRTMAHIRCLCMIWVSTAIKL